MEYNIVFFVGIANEYYAGIYTDKYEAEIRRRYSTGISILIVGKIAFSAAIIFTRLFVCVFYFLPGVLENAQKSCEVKCGKPGEDTAQLDYNRIICIISANNQYKC